MSPLIYPLNALPPGIHAAVTQAISLIQAPVALIATSAISAASLACQDKVDVRRLGTLESPCSLFTLVVSESGERKSTADKLFIQGIRDFEQEYHEQHRSALDRFDLQRAAWEAEQRAVLQALARASARGKSTTDIESQLARLQARAPERPVMPKLVVGDATIEALLARLHKQWPSAGVFSDEASSVFSSRTLNNLGVYNKLWDGDPLHVDRVHSDSFTLKNARLSISLMVQRAVLDRFLGNQQRLARASGFMARFLVCEPPSTQGTRFIHVYATNTHAIEAFRARTKELIAESAGHRQPSARRCLEMTSQAEAAWVAFANRVEADLRVGCFLSDVRDCAAKIAENAARLAAVFHVYERRDGKIEAETIQQAIEICGWHLMEYKRLFGGGTSVPPEVEDARDLERWLHELVVRFPGATEVRKNHIAQYGPNKLRARVRLDSALGILASEGKVTGVIRGRTTVVLLNPQIFRAPGSAIAVPLQAANWNGFGKT